MTSTQMLRAALTALADEAPSPSVLDHSVWTSGDQPARPRARSLRPAGVLAVLASAAAVAAVVAATLSASSSGSTGQAGSDTDPTWASMVFGPNSMPGMELDQATLTRTGQTFHFDTPGAAYDQLAFVLDVVTPDSALSSILDHETTVEVGPVTGRYSTTPVTTGNSVLSWLDAGTPAPAGKYDGTTVPEVSVIAWPLDTDRWAILHPEYVDGSENAVLSSTALATRAASIVRADSDQVAGVRVGYVPPGLAFSSAAYAPISRSSTILAAGRPSTAGLTATATRTLSFTSAPGTDASGSGRLSLSVEVLDGVTLIGRTPSELPQLYGTQWRQTTSNGHLAWVSTHDILIQWGAVVLGVSGVSPNDVPSALSSDELLKVANSLEAPRYSGEQPYPLSQAVPVSTLN